MQINIDNKPRKHDNKETVALDPGESPGWTRRVRFESLRNTSWRLLWETWSGSDRTGREGEDETGTGQAGREMRAAGRKQLLTPGTDGRPVRRFRGSGERGRTKIKAASSRSSGKVPYELTTGPCGP